MWACPRANVPGGSERGCGNTGGWVWGCVCACVYKVAHAIKNLNLGEWGGLPIYPPPLAQTLAMPIYP